MKFEPSYYHAVKLKSRSDGASQVARSKSQNTQWSPDMTNLIDYKRGGEKKNKKCKNLRWCRHSFRHFGRPHPERKIHVMKKKKNENAHLCCYFFFSPQTCSATVCARDNWFSCCCCCCWAFAGEFPWCRWFASAAPLRNVISSSFSCATKLKKNNINMFFIFLSFKSDCYLPPKSFNFKLLLQELGLQSHFDDAFSLLDLANNENIENIVRIDPFSQKCQRRMSSHLFLWQHSGFVCGNVMLSLLDENKNNNCFRKSSTNHPAAVGSAAQFRGASASKKRFGKHEKVRIKKVLSKRTTSLLRSISLIWRK